MFYAQVGENGKVHTVQDTPSRFVEIEYSDDRLLGTVYNVDSGEFIGYRITLSTDKTEIVADGKDTSTITANIETWDEQTGSSFTDDVVFEVNGQQVPATVTDGQAIFEFASNETGSYTVKTVNTEDIVMSNGSIEIEVIESEE